MKHRNANKKALFSSISSWTNNISTVYFALTFVEPLNRSGTNNQSFIAIVYNLFLTSVFFLISYNSSKQIYGKS